MRNGRRLRHAADRIDEAVAAFHTRARTLTPAETEGDVELCGKVQGWLRLAAELLKLRYVYLRVPPWSFCNADTTDGARAFLLKATSQPMDKQDTLTQYLYATHREALEVLAGGGPCAASSAYAVSVINETALDESVGEGYHRSTKHSKVRAPNGTTRYLKQSTRVKQNTRLVRRFQRLGPSGIRVVRFEWRRWKRVLQANRKHMWKNKKLKNPAVYDKVYRMDEAADEDWTQVCSLIDAPGQGASSRDVTAHLTTREKEKEALRVEYLQAVIEPQTWYSVRVPKAGIDEETGAPVEREELKYFEVISLVTAATRPHVMPTTESRQDVTQSSRFAISLIEGSEKEELRTEDRAIVYIDGDADWKAWQDLGPFDDVHRTLSRYKSVADADHPACLQLTECERARPRHALTDMKCPTLPILAECYRRGWRPADQLVTHHSLDIGLMDSRLAVRMKAYYIVLLELPRCLPLTSEIPSNQPILFYRLLLQGRPVEPFLGQQAYLAIQRGREPLVAPPIEDVSDTEVPSKIMHNSTNSRIVKTLNDTLLLFNVLMMVRWHSQGFTICLHVFWEAM